MVSPCGHNGAGSRIAPAAANTRPGLRRRPGRQPVALPARLESIHAAYTAQLRAAALSGETRRTYASKARQYLAWLHATDAGAAAFTDPAARDRAVSAWRTHLLTAASRAPATVNNALAAVDDFYTRLGLGPAAVDRIDVPATAPRGLDRQTQARWLAAVQAHPAPRDRALAGIPFYAGARIAETVRLDTADVTAPAHGGGLLRIHGSRQRIREVPLHPTLSTDIRSWLAHRPTCSGAHTNPALFLNNRGGRLSVRGARDIIVGIAEAAGLGQHITAQVLRHSFGATLVRGGTDLTIVADLLGHARLETTRGYTNPTAEDRIKALNLLPSTS